MIRSSSAPSSFLPAKSGKAAVASASPKKGLVGRKLRGAKGPGPLGRAGGELILSSPTPGASSSLAAAPKGSYLLLGDGPDARARLPHSGASELWSRHSSKHIVRDLYASYAADPLAPHPRAARMSPSASSSDAGTPTAGSSARPCFLERYVRQQAHIEQLLAEWTPPERVPDEAADDAQGGDLDDVLSSAFAEEDDGDSGPPQAIDTFSMSGEKIPLQVVAKTRNAVFDGDTMSCSTHGGGARFHIPDASAFRFCVRPLDPPETHPFFIGMVPAGVDVSEASFFDRKEGIFLRVGGYPAGLQATDGPLPDDHDPLKPVFEVFGERSQAPLPEPRIGRRIAMHYYEAYPRQVHVTEKIQCLGCKLLLDSTELFAEHCFEDTDAHPDDFGFDSCRRVEIFKEGDYNFDPHLRKMHVRFQAESDRGPRGKALSAMPPAMPHGPELRNDVPPLPRELPELVGGRTAFGPKGPWQACVLLCVPGTRVEVSWLTSGRPVKPPNPPEVRPARGSAKLNVDIPGRK